MKFDMQLRRATKTSWVVSYGYKTIPRWRTAAILKIDISPYLSEKNHRILMKVCTQQQLLNWMNITWSKMKKSHWTDSEFDRTYFLFLFSSSSTTYNKENSNNRFMKSRDLRTAPSSVLICRRLLLGQHLPSNDTAGGWQCDCLARGVLISAAVDYTRSSHSDVPETTENNVMNILPSM